MSAGSVVIVDTWAALAFLRREGSADLTMRRYLKRARMMTGYPEILALPREVVRVVALKR